MVALELGSPQSNVPVIGECMYVQHMAARHLISKASLSRSISWFSLPRTVRLSTVNYYRVSCFLRV